MLMRKFYTCTIPGCGKPHLSRGYCQFHWTRWYDHGDPLKGKDPVHNPQYFFYNTVIKYKNKDCLIWPFGKDKNSGYGVFTYHSNFMGVHRAVCLEVYGDPPTKLHQAAHICGVTSCCNPNHLRWATRSENELDKIVHGTSNRGSRHGVSKLVESDVIQIRNLYGTESASKIGRKFGVCGSTILGMWHWKQWKWLPQPVVYRAVREDRFSEVELTFVLDEGEDLGAALDETAAIVKAKALDMVGIKVVARGK